MEKDNFNIILEAKDLILDLNQKFQDSKKGFSDEIKLQNHLNIIVNKINKSKKFNNDILIELEKFYQNLSLLIGIGNIKLTKEAKQSWKKYDKFHFDNIKPNLRLYGPIAMM